HADDRRTQRAPAAAPAPGVGPAGMRGDEPHEVERRRLRNAIGPKGPLGLERAAALVAALGMRLDGSQHFGGEGIGSALVERGGNVMAVHRDSPETAAMRGGWRSASSRLPRRARARCRRAFSAPSGTPVISIISARL